MTAYKCKPLPFISTKDFPQQRDKKANKMGHYFQILKRDKTCYEC